MLSRYSINILMITSSLLNKVAHGQPCSPAVCTRKSKANGQHPPSHLQKLALASVDGSARALIQIASLDK